MSSAVITSVLRAALEEGPEVYDRMKKEVETFKRKQNEEDDTIADLCKVFIETRPDLRTGKPNRKLYIKCNKILKDYWEELILIYWKDSIDQ